MKSSFNSWLTKCFDFCKSTSKDEDFIPRLELSYMKPVYARWVINAFNIMKERKEIIIDAWKLSGLHDIIKNAHDGVELTYLLDMKFVSKSHNAMNQMMKKR